MMLTVGQLQQLIAKSVPIIEAKPRKENMSIDEVVIETNYSKPTIYKMVSNRQIPHHKPEHGGKMLVFKRAEIEEWMSARNIPTLASISKNALKRK